MDPVLIAQLLMGVMNQQGGSSGGKGGFLGTGFNGLIPMLLNRKKPGDVNNRPVLKESGIYDNLLGLFENQAQYGIDANSLNFAKSNNENGLTNALSTLLQGNGNPNQVSDLFGKFADSMNELAYADSDKRWQKVNALSDITDKLFNAKREEFQYNVDAPYKDKAQLSAARQQADFMQGQINNDAVMGNLMKALNSNYSMATPKTNVTTPAGGNTANSSAITQLLKQLASVDWASIGN